MISQMIRLYYCCCCINEPVIFSRCVQLKLGHQFHAMLKVCFDHDDIAPLIKPECHHGRCFVIVDQLLPPWIFLNQEHIAVQKPDQFRLRQWCFLLNEPINQHPICTSKHPAKPRTSSLLWEGWLPGYTGPCPASLPWRVQVYVIVLFFAGVGL